MKELALRACYAGNACFTRFLEPPMERDALSAANEAGVCAAFFGGYDGAERRIAAFYTDEAPEAWEYPIACLELKWNPKYAAPGHRDLLGAVMGLGLERDATGDIAMGAQEGTAYLFCHRDVESYICGNLESAGRASLKVKSFDGVPALKPPEGVELRVTVSSERLDAVIAAGLRLSRSEAQKLIEAGLVKRSHMIELRGDIHLEEGDLLSIRGHGRMRITAFEGQTRKGRLAVRLFKYTA
ncbi:MAG: RNA-binding protein [Clostridia bacterium]|nr:RNA-binding protein [Clostridia bacterium]